MAGAADEWDPYELVPCPHCAGTGHRTRHIHGGEVRRACPACKGTPGRQLRGEPHHSPIGLMLDYTENQAGMARAIRLRTQPKADA